jgi:hypothetical protein
VLGAQFFGLGLLGEYLAHGSAGRQTETNLTALVRERIGFPVVQPEVSVVTEAFDLMPPATDGPIRS